MKPDFAGWVTKNGLKCSDGRTIMPDAFKHQDKMKVPMLWAHGHDDPDNVLGHMMLTNRPEGVWGEAFFNGNQKSQNTKKAVQHGDLEWMSIYANQLLEKGKQVFHGMIKEVSLVLAGANPGARIQHVTLEHQANGEIVFEIAHEDEDADGALIFTGEKIVHGDALEDVDEEPEEDVEDEESEDEPDEDADDEESEDEPEEDAVQHSDDETIMDVINTMSPKQKNAFAYVLSQVTSDVQHSDEDTEGEDLEHQEGNEVKTKTRNVFEQNADEDVKTKDNVLSHDDMKSIVRGAVEGKKTLKQAVEEYALSHGIEDIETLFPNFKDLDTTPQFISRRMEWVANVMNNVGHSPFSRIRTRFADITMEEARAKGYIKGNMKKEEWFKVSKRETGPTTVYKKQKLDRDDVLDITDFNAITWVQAEMKVMLQEEVARAILIGDGRPAEDPANPGEPNPDKISEPEGASGNGIRSILNDDELYSIKVNVNLQDTGSDQNELVDGILSAMQNYRGAGAPTLYMSLPNFTKVLLSRDTLKRRIYQTKADVAAAMGVADIQTVEVMEELTDGTIGIIVNLHDYNVGTDAGGELSFFDFFDIDYNQYKYLYETRFSGALTRYRSAIVLKQVASGDTAVDLGAPTAPTFDDSTGVVTIPTETHVTYKDGTGATLTAGPQTALNPGESLDVVAVAASGYYFDDSINDNWTFERPHSA